MAAIARPVTKQEAISIAQHFGQSTSASLRTAYVRTPVLRSSQGHEALFYVFNKGNDQGYVVVAGDDRVQPILAWSDTGSLTEEDILNHPSIKWMYDEYALQISWAIEHLADTPSGDFNTLRSSTRASYEVQIEPLLAFEKDRKTKRRNAVSLGQDWPFNKYCPNYVYQGRSYPTVSGCVATAISTVMRWHEWPKKPVGSFAYNWGNNRLSLDFDKAGAKENQAYDWSQMPEAVSANGSDKATNQKLNETQADNYGRLLRDVGYTVKMNYGPAAAGGSGAYMYDVPRALRTHFGYSSSVADIKRADYKDKDWLAEIYAEMKENGPVVYAGYSRGGGHCFVLDGFATNGYVHVDWGWNGSANGWHLLNTLKPGSEGIGGGSGGYSRGQEMIRHMTPEKGVDPNPDGGETSEANLSIAEAVNNQKASNSTSAKLVAKVKNADKKDWTGTLALAIFEKNATKASVYGAQKFTLKAGKTSELTFTCDLSKFETGNYQIMVFYRKGDSYARVEGLAGTVDITKENITPDDKTAQLDIVEVALPQEKIYQGTNTKFAITIQNSGKADYTQYLRLYAVNGNAPVEISSGNVTIAQGKTVTASFYTNNTFKNLKAGSYTLRLAYDNNGTETFFSGRNGEDLATFTIEGKDDVKPDNKQDVRMTTAAFYQNGTYLGKDYARVSKSIDRLYARVYLHSTTGYTGKIRAFISASKTTGVPDNNLVVEANIRMNEGMKGYVDFYFFTSLFRYTSYFLNIMFQTENGQWVHYPQDAVPFYVTGYYALDPNATYSNEPTDGPSYNFDEAPGTWNNNEVVSVGAEAQDSKIGDETAISDVNEAAEFIMEEGDALVIAVKEAGHVAIFDMAGTALMNVDVKDGLNKVAHQLPAGTYVASFNGRQFKFTIH